MKVQAHKPGFYGGIRRHAGDIFEAERGAKASWFSPVDAAEAPKPRASRKQKSEGPETFSEIAKADAEALAPEGE